MFLLNVRRGFSVSNEKKEISKFGILNNTCANVHMKRNLNNAFERQQRRLEELLLVCAALSTSLDVVHHTSTGIYDLQLLSVSFSPTVLFHPSINVK